VADETVGGVVGGVVADGDSAGLALGELQGGYHPALDFPEDVGAVEFGGGEFSVGLLGVRGTDGFGVGFDGVVAAVPGDEFLVEEGGFF